MDSGKLGNLLRLLNERERERMLDFLHSPYFGRSTAAIRLYEFWLDKIQQSQALPEDLALFEALYPGEPFDAVKLKNDKAALQRKLDDFMVQEGLQSDLAAKLRAQLHFLNQHQEGKYFPYYLTKAGASLESAGLDALNEALAEYQIQMEAYAYSFRQESRAATGEALSGFSHASRFMSLESLKYLIREENKRAILGESQPDERAEAVLALLGPSQPDKVMQLYASLLKLFREPENPQAFGDMETLLKRDGAALPLSDARELYTGAINHCIRRINRGEARYLQAMLGLYQQMEPLELLLINGWLPAPQFKNLVVLGLRCGDFAWVEAMIEKYGERVTEDAHGNAKAFNLGVMHFFQGDLAQSERCFNKVLESYDDVFYGLDARAYLLRIHFETGNSLGLESLVDSFKMFLKRNKNIPKGHRDSYLLATKFFRRLVRIPPFEKQRLAKLKTDIEQTHFAAGSKQWLLKKIASMIE